MAEWQDITSNPQNHPQIVDIQQYGDTTYYTITPKNLPLVRPLHLIPFIGKPIADLIEPALRVIIEETGYNRDIPFGAPIGTRFIPFFNPITLFLKLIPAVFVGINNFLADFGLATEIPLSPTDPIPAPPAPVVSSLVNQQDQPVDNPDDSSGARMALVQEDGAVDQQQGEGDAQMLAAGTEGDLTEGTEGTIEETEGTAEETEGTIEGTTEGTDGKPEGTEPEGTQPEGTEPEKTEIEAVEQHRPRREPRKEGRREPRSEGTRREQGRRGQQGRCKRWQRVVELLAERRRPGARRRVTARPRTSSTLPMTRRRPQMPTAPTARGSGVRRTPARPLPDGDYAAAAPGFR